MQKFLGTWMITKQNIKQVFAVNYGILRYYLKEGILTSHTGILLTWGFCGGQAIDVDNGYKIERKMEFLCTIWDCLLQYT